MKKLTSFLLATAWLGLLAAHAQSITVIYALTNYSSTNGIYPNVGLTLGPDGNLYGTTSGGGTGHGGTIFKITTTGAFTPLVEFSNTNGNNPNGSLALGPDDQFYGITSLGGSSGWGTVFRMTTNGTLTTLVNFSVTNGGYPNAGLTLGPDGNFYSTTTYGGTTADLANTNLGYGTLFQVTTNGTLVTLVNFANTNGAHPYAAPALGSDGNFYGTTQDGGGKGYGTVFKVSTDGTLTTIADLAYTNGANPYGGLTPAPDGNLYGTTFDGGKFNGGNVFKVTTNGEYMVLTNLGGLAGMNPNANMALGPDGNFYVTALMGGRGLDGTVFKVTTNGSLRVLINFSSYNVWGCYSSLTLGPDGNFYGTTEEGGLSYTYGTVFRLNLPPEFIVSPTNQPAPVGGSAMFNCKPFGTAPFAYQWLSNGIPIAAATAASLMVSNITWQTATNAQFQVAVTNLWGSITSGVAVINLSPAMTSQPADQTVPIGSPAIFTASATGFSPLSSQWYFNNGFLPGATNPALIISPSLTNETGTYQLVVTNAYGSATSRLASLSVLVQPNSYGISNSGGGKPTIYIGSYPGSSNRLWAGTNLALPIQQWQVIATNVMDTNGLGQFLDTNTLGIPRKFYRLSYP